MIERVDTKAIRYILVGGLTTLVNLVIFSVLCKIAKIDVTISNIISVIVAILFAYVMNKVYVFRSKTHGIDELFAEAVKFIGTRLLTMIIEIGGVFLLVNVIGEDEFICKLETQVIVVIGNYFISRFYVFKGERV